MLDQRGRKKLGTLAKRHRAAQDASTAATLAFLEALDSAYDTGGETIRSLAEITGLSYQRVWQLLTRPGRPGSLRKDRP
jgi:hypothetical protein